jgi:hypothetical protein
MGNFGTLLARELIVRRPQRRNYVSNLTFHGDIVTGDSTEP